MNLPFTDINSFVSAVTQSEIPGASALAGAKDQMAGPEFARKLDRVMGDRRPGSVNGMDQTGGHNASAVGQAESSVRPVKAERPILRPHETSTPVPGSAQDALDGKEGIAFLKELKSLLAQLANGDLDNLSLDGQGLETLKKLLTEAGFDEQGVSQVISGLQAILEEGQSITMDDLFDQLLANWDEIMPPDSFQPEETLMETADRPYIESVLSALNLPREIIDSILTAAERSDSAISLDSIIDNLNRVQRKAFATGTSFQTGPDDNQVQNLLARLGIESDSAENSRVTLNDFVSALENLRNDSRARAALAQQTETAAAEGAGNQKSDTQTLLKDLFNALEVRKQPGQSTEPHFTEEGSKRHLSAGSLIPESGSADTRSIFESMRDKKGVGRIKSAAGPLEETGMTPVKNKTGVTDVLFKETAENVVKTARSKMSLSQDSAQAGQAESKAATAQPGQVVAKAQAGFKALPNFVTQQVSKSIVRAVNQGENTLRIQLKPPELGRLMLTIDNSGNAMKVNVVTENAATREILLSNVNELRTVLSNSGVNLERFDVDMSSDFRQSMADARGQSGSSSKRGQKRQSAGIAGQNSDSPAGETTETATLSGQGRSLHYVA